MILTEAARMTTASSARLDRTLSALSDGTRRAILLRLREGEARVTDIAVPFRMSLNAVSKHVQVLERAGLVRPAGRGREHWLAFDRAALEAAAEWIQSMRRVFGERPDPLPSLLLAHPPAPGAETKHPSP